MIVAGPGKSLLVLTLISLLGCAEADRPEETPPSAPATPWLYLIDSGGETSRLLRVRLDGTGLETVVDTLAPAARGIVLEPASRTLVWASRDGDRIQRARLGEAGLEAMADLPAQGLDSAYAVAIDQARGHLYWSDYGTGAIHRANLDGSDPQKIVTGLVAPRGIDLDTAGGLIYWTDVGTKEVKRARLDGSEATVLLTAKHGLDQPYGVTLDLTNGIMYVTNAGNGSIFRAKTDGTALQTLIPQSGPHPSFLIVLDDGHIVWGDNRANRVRRARLDGTEIQDVIPAGLSGPRGLVVVR